MTFHLGVFISYDKETGKKEFHINELEGNDEGLAARDVEVILALFTHLILGHASPYQYDIVDK
jgi:hypothetical protein